jgi:hypothetical protein
MGRTPITPLRLTLGDRAALDAIASHMKVDDRTTAVRKLIYDFTREQGLTAHAANAFVAKLIESYHANAALVVTSEGEDATVMISGHEASGIRAVIVDNDLVIEDPHGPAEIVLLTIEAGYTGDLRWEGTLADLAAVAAEQGE